MNNNDLWSKINLSEDDIIIASTIKSGTTWLQQIIAQLVFKGEFKENLSDISYWIDTVREYSEEEMISNICKQKHRRFFKTHSPASVVLANEENTPKYIFITRDFRDVVWSFYNHFVNSKYKIRDHSKENEITLKLRASTNPYEFWKIVMKNKEIFKRCKSYKIIWSYFITIKTWLEIKDRENVLILHFNDLKQDLKGIIRKVSSYLGYNYKDEVIDKIYTKCTFEYMKQNSTQCVPVAFKNRKGFINKGTNKRWESTLNEDDFEEYNNLIQEFFNDDVIQWIENGGNSFKQ